MQMIGFSSPHLTLIAIICNFPARATNHRVGAFTAPTLSYTYEGDPPLYVAVVEVAFPHGAVRPVQLPGDGRVGEEEEQAGDEGAEQGHGHDEAGVVQGSLVPDPVHGAGQAEGLGAVAAPAQKR